VAGLTLPARSRSGSRWLGPLVLAVAGLASLGMSPSPPPAYVEDQLLVEFFHPLTDVELELFETKYMLALGHRISGQSETYLFRILDGFDAKLKQRFVADDPNVCRVTLNWLGEFLSTGPERPFGRCEGDEVGLPWEPSASAKPTNSETTPMDSAMPRPTESALVDSAPVQHGSGQPPARQVGLNNDALRWIGLAIVVASVATATALIARKRLRLQDWGRTPRKR
jgi:hypothetical protein